MLLMKISLLKQILHIRQFLSVSIRYTAINLKLSTAVKRPDSKLNTMKLDSPQFHAIFTPEVNGLSELFQKYGYGLRMAGGAVRDLLMHKHPEDLDFATTATPEEMKKMFGAEGIRMLHRKGEAHGTVTIRLNDKQNFEITTLRIDTSTDGRHAEVKFTTDWELDAGRRDLTINAMFLGLDGTIYDYFNGKKDLEDKCIRFVGDPNGRIQEDYLRILRYFRFYGRIASQPDCHDIQILEAIRSNAEGLGKISGERIWMELKKILSGNYAKEIMLRMIDLGIAPFIGLPENPNINEYKEVCERSYSMKPHPVTRLTALLTTEDEVQSLHSRIKFSKYDRDLSLFIINNKTLVGKPPLRPFIYLLFQSKSKVSDTHEWCCEILKYRGELCLWKELSELKIPKFPVSGHILVEKGLKPGPEMTNIMTNLKNIWIDSNFKMTKEELLDYLDKNTHGDC
ncbi:CCA tRNA nucleotidyltransferase 1, mitochondrial [Parasteatoda tepidariorum]|uniref:CCA tRNA nucleotidyltransferase 1, mitochondrial n=1 Tax=Parasteatoda tepidariorum TaxID=114398 RepID=UPI001C729AE6|nr:CCA tRNA nucleotidyltransferase 1, mitochondrial [Parasteatoda tepidariorum]XP_042907113.1 CCA tRNA nucleotidyltransferase 1, mitochondrial [Parasteatoda tepidariorum]